MACNNRPAQTVSGLTLFADGPTWVDIQAMESDGDQAPVTDQSVEDRHRECLGGGQAEEDQHGDDPAFDQHQATGQRRDRGQQRGDQGDEHDLRQAEGDVQRQRLDHQEKTGGLGQPDQDGEAEQEREPAGKRAQQSVLEAAGAIAKALG